uniref:CARD domain-containing protein n=1 Tax=Syphacia muris TaxID=451379 RepID=A0A0N5AA94_9BILA
MKYGKHQMMLIRKRMSVENWLDEQLAELYNGDTDIEIDVDKVLDLETIPERRRLVLDLIQQTNCPASADRIHSFLDEMMEKLNTL